MWVGSYGGLEYFNANIKSTRVETNTSTNFVMDILPGSEDELILGSLGLRYCLLKHQNHGNKAGCSRG
jgi:hypothetical protein